MRSEYTLVIKKAQDGYLIGSIIELPGCHILGKTNKELLNKVKDAVENFLKVEKPESTTEFIGIRKISL